MKSFLCGGGAQGNQHNIGHGLGRRRCAGGGVRDGQWKAALDQSHLSTVRFIRPVLPDMKKKKWGRILAIQSSSVKQPVEGLILSNGIRPGIAGMFKTLANELGRDGITVNMVLPGRIRTERLPAPRT